MALKYNKNKHYKELLPILDDHAEWFHSLVKCFFYPEEAGELCGINKPTSFAKWSVYVNRKGEVPPEIIDKLSSLHADLFALSDVLVNISRQTGERPPKKDFEKFLTVYEEFFLYIRRLEKDYIIEGSGYDAFTGLRNKNILIVDIERELQRFARQGKSFCIALIKIDNFAAIKEKASEKEVDGYIKLIAGLIKLSIRSFDDAYYLGDDEFALCLKQSDVSGGVSALERLRQELERQGVFINIDNKDIPLSMSCCIAEPVCDDNIEELIEDLRSDLKNSEFKKTDTVLEYHELSPLERYVQKGG